MKVVNDELKKMAQDLGSKPESFKTQGNECLITLIDRELYCLMVYEHPE